MKAFFQILTSSLGKKYIMAITGFGLVGFVIIHMLGNLQIFLGAETLNTYAKLLKSSAEVLWGFRLGLLGMAVLHIVCAISLVLDNRRARPAGYVKERNLSSWASRTMIVSGLIVSAFVIYHILHFTVQVTDPSYQNLTTELHGQEVHDVYRMVIQGFSNPYISAFYILSVGLLSWHLSHGISSMFQSIGLRNQRSARLLDLIALGLSTLIFLGMSSVPAAVLLKIVS
ncbi:MAG: succinate dehydrogenase cytochrome b subunit [Candidatus Methylacidiphilales bacterium]|nr:succinate dehydrogenase cytochrome b subunit [Candidatus Methylacidiphilales bacterium]